MTLLIYALVLCLTSWSVDARRSDYVGSIQPHTYTSWGSWGHEDWCSAGNYAYGFRLKVKGPQGDSGDDTALNGIKLLCSTFCGSHSHSVTSSVQKWGYWRRTNICPAHYFLKGASARSMKKQGSGMGEAYDDSAVNNYDFLCELSQYTSHTYQLYGDGLSWGSWTGRRDCPSGSYICGIKTQIEPDQGKLNPTGGDDSALNDAIFYCCRMRKTKCGNHRHDT